MTTLFLNDYLKEKVYVEKQRGRFFWSIVPHYAFKLDKYLDGPEQAPSAWYRGLSMFLMENEYKRGTIDKTLFTKTRGRHFLVVQIYVDDIIFGATHQLLYDEFINLMQSELEMSMMDEISFFLSLLIIVILYFCCIASCHPLAPPTRKTLLAGKF